MGARFGERWKNQAQLDSEQQSSDLLPSIHLCTTDKEMRTGSTGRLSFIFFGYFRLALRWCLEEICEQRTHWRRWLQPWREFPAAAGSEWEKDGMPSMTARKNNARPDIFLPRCRYTYAVIVKSVMERAEQKRREKPTCISARQVKNKETKKNTRRWLLLVRQSQQSVGERIRGGGGGCRTA